VRVYIETYVCLLSALSNSAIGGVKLVNTAMSWINVESQRKDYVRAFANLDAYLESLQN